MSRDQTRRFFTVPSFVPDWGLPEFLITAGSLIAGRVVSGKSPGRFAAAVQSELGVRFALPVNRARFGIQLGLQAMRVGQGDEVILPSYACEVLLEPILNVGATPIFADTGPDLHLTAESVKRAITSKTKGVIVPHHYGNVAPIDEIENLLLGTGIFLVDDAAQSFGARCAGRPVGTFGDFGVVGCGPAKSLGAAAGALLLTNDPELHQRVAALPLAPEKTISVVRRVGAFWVWFRFRRYFLGFKTVSDTVLSRSADSGERPAMLSNLDAWLGVRQVRTWSRNAQRRRREAATILKMLARSRPHCLTDLSDSCLALRIAIILPADGVGVESAIQTLSDAGIEARRGYEPLHNSSAHGGGDLETTDSLARRVILLPIAGRLTARAQRALAALG